MKYLLNCWHNKNKCNIFKVSFLLHGKYSKCFNYLCREGRDRLLTMTGHSRVKIGSIFEPPDGIGRRRKCWTRQIKSRHLQTAQSPRPWRNTSAQHAPAVTTKNPVCRHYKRVLEHKPKKQRNNSARTLLHGLSDYHRKNQIRQFLSELKEEEMTRIVLPALSKLVTTFDYMLSRCTNRWNANKAESLERAVHQELVLLLS